MLGLTFFSKLDWGSYNVFIAKTAKTIAKTIGVLICSNEVSFLRLLCIFINLPHNHAWNTVVMFGLVLLIATWNC